MFSIPEVLAEFSEKYALPKAWVLDGIQKGFESVLSERYRRQVMVEINEEGFACWMYGRDNGIVQQYPLPLDQIRGWNTIKRRIEFYLRKLAVFRDFDNLRPYEQSLVWGKPAVTDSEGTVYVHTEIRLGEVITCVYERKSQPVKEREEGYMPGETRAFHVTKVRAVLLNGVPRLKVFLDRTSLNLPLLLIREAMVDEGMITTGFVMRSVLRMAGVRSLVASNEKVPKGVIEKVQRELREHVRVVYGKKAMRYISKMIEAKKRKAEYEQLLVAQAMERVKQKGQEGGG